MIEKIMKAVKSGNKKRGRNITIGAVVGMLLSCTAVMGEDVLGLKLTNDGSGIKFSKDGKEFIPKDEETEKKDPYFDNNWNEETYTNNTVIYGKSADANGYGISIVGDKTNKININITNNGIISGAGNGKALVLSEGHGINIVGGEDNKININVTNNGIINGTGNNTYTSSATILSGYGNGIYSKYSVGNITNSGLITGIGNAKNPSNSPGSGRGIYFINSEGAITNNGVIVAIGNGSAYDAGSGMCINASKSNITNSGLITGIGNGDKGGKGYGIDITSASNSNIANSGVIRGSSSKSEGYGINIVTSTDSNKSVSNSGIVYGKANAIKKSGDGTLSQSYNYGILVSGDSSTNKVVSDTLTTVVPLSTSVLSSDSTDDQIINYGLAFVDTGSGYKTHNGSDDNHNFGNTPASTVKIGKTDYTIRNVAASVSSGVISSIKSFGIKGGNLYQDIVYDSTDASTLGSVINDASTSNVILNGIENTLKVVGASEENNMSNAIINAYGTAIEFDGTSGGSLSLSRTTVNGGVKTGTFTVKGSAKTDNLTLENGTIINGNVDMGAEADTLTIGNRSQINGTLDGGDTTSKDTLNFGVFSNLNAIAASNGDEIRILHDISNFENINVNSNVTFYEKTADADGKIKDLAVTGVKDLTIGKNGVLTLRIDTSTGTATHALAGNTGTIKSVDGGKLLLALNGAGKSTKISFGSLELDKSLITGYEGEYQKDVTFETTSALHSVKRTSGTNEVEVEAKKNLPLRPSGSGDSSDDLSYEKLNKIYQSLINEIGNFNVENDDNGKSMSLFLSYLNDIYAGNPYSYSSELSRKSAGMFRDIVVDNIFRPETNKWMIYGGLTHIDGGTKDTYYGKGYYTTDIGSSDMDADTKITGAYILGEYGISDTLTSGVVIGGNKLKSDLSNGSKVDGSAMYLGAYAKKYVGNLKVTAGAGFQYGDYDADRMAVNRVASETGEAVTKYSSNYNDMIYDIYLNGRYSNPMGDNFFLEPYATLSYTYVDQDGANEGNKTLAIETDSKSFDYTVGKVGVDLKKVIPHEKGKSILSAGVSYTRIFDGADEEYITGRFKGGSDFDILVAHKNEHSIGVNAKYALELENGVIFDVKGTYSVERDSHNQSGKNKTKGEWIVGAGLGYKF